ncbi:hypothetical protein EMCRGX_G000224 [Ephydatia muelleri]
MCWLIKKWTRGCNAYRLLTGTNCVILFLGLVSEGGEVVTAHIGLMETLIGPTLLDRANYIGSTLTEIASIFFLRGAGYVVGGAVMGTLGDQFNQHTYLLLCVALLWSIVMGVAQALSYTFVMVCIMTFIYEMGSAGIDNGVHKVILKVWDKRAGPYLQLIDFSYALGAFIAPLLAQPFLIQQQGSNATNVTCTSHDPANGSRCDAECWLGTCSQSNTTQQYYVILNETDWSLQLPPFPRFAWAYVIAVLPWLCALIPFAIISIRTDDFSVISSCHSPSMAKVSGHTQHKSKCCFPRSPKDSHACRGGLGKGVGRTVVIYSIAFLLISIYYGLSFAYGGLVFTFAVETLHFSKVEATNLNSLFYGTFAAGGVVSIILVLINVPLGVIMVLNVAGSLVNTLMMVVFPSNIPIIWLGTGGLGASMASIYSTTFAWLAKHVLVNGMGTAVMIAAISIADMVHAAVLGILMEHTTPLPSPVLCTWEREARAAETDHNGAEMGVASSGDAMGGMPCDPVADQVKLSDIVSDQVKDMESDFERYAVDAKLSDIVSEQMERTNL